MKLIFSLIFLVWCGNGYAENMRMPINEYSTQIIKPNGGGYTEIGSGINYQKDDGSWDSSSAVFVPSKRTGIDWECYTTYNRIGLKANINDGDYSVFTQLGNDGQILRSKPVAIAYLNTDTKEWTIIANLQSSIASVSGNKILYKDAFKNCDLEYVIQKDRLKQNLYIKATDGFGKSPYDADKTQVVIVTKFDLDNFETPKIVDSRGEVSLATMKLASVTAKNVGDETLDGELVFTKQRFGMCEATDAKGDTQKIRKRIIKHDGNYYLLEGLPYSWLASASYPVLLDYTTVSSNPADNTTWANGTYYVSTSITASGLILDDNAIVKCASGVSLSVNGLQVTATSTAWAYMTSKNDNSIGETIDGSSGSPAAGDWTGIARTYWQTGAVSIQNCVMRYASGGFAFGNVWGGGAVTINDSLIMNCTSGITGSADNAGFSVVIYDTQFISCGTGANPVSGTYYRCLFKSNTLGQGPNGATFYNCTFDSNTTGHRSQYSWNAKTLNNCIVSNNTTNFSDEQGATITYNYCLQYNNTTTNTPDANNNALTPANPNFSTGTAATGYIGDMAYFLNQATSPCIDAGSDTAANLGMDAHTTATDKTLDGDDVDVGYHYEPDDVGTAAGGTRRFFLVS
jgi:hypothetical protein